MGLWFLLGGLLVLVVWTVAFTFDWSATFPVALSIVMALGLFGVWAFRRIAALRAARKIEQAMAKQSAAEAEALHPERRAAIEAMQRRLEAGIRAVKARRRGGRATGEAALHSLPWYVIVGPPGAGKTTALTQSGLGFASVDEGGPASVRDVGGTRACSFWFANDAVLIDTAGRYAMERDDRDEWLSFLRTLVKHRPKRPIHGIIVAVGISELAEASEADIEQIGKRLRARIDEVVSELHMLVPVYVLFTKMDLVDGFGELFGDLKRSDRSQVWGATIPFDAPREQPRRLFETELDVLLGRLHGRALRRLGTERSREARERLFRFPIELAALKKNLADLVEVTFAPSAFQTTPMFRGFYFTSGTQEGKPLDRALEKMTAAMGIKAGPRVAAARVEPKSYFLHDLFVRVIFKDGDAATLSVEEARRQTFLKLAIAGVTVCLAAILCVPAVLSYRANRAFLAESESKAKVTAKVRFDDPQKLGDKLARLRPAYELLRRQDDLEKHRPWGMGFWMYQADKVYPATLKLYAARMAKGFVEPSKARLEQQLLLADPVKQYVRTRSLLKQYLMLGDPKNLDVEWATGRFTRTWSEAMAGRSDLPDADLKDRMRPHIGYWLELVHRGKLAPVALDQALIERVRGALLATPVPERYYAMFVLSLEDELRDEAMDPDNSNRVFPSIDLTTVFPNEAPIRKYFRSRSFEAGRGFTRVDGPYTEKGHAGVEKQMKAAKGLLQAESWVVPLSEEERSPEKVSRNLVTLKASYEANYIRQWEGFMADLVITTPAPDDVATARRLYGLIASAEGAPHRRLLEVLCEHTQWRNANPLEGQDAVQREANRRFNQKLNMYTQGIAVNVDAVGLLTSFDRIPEKFKRTCQLVEQPKGPSASRSGDSPIAQYMAVVLRLNEKIEDTVSKRSPAPISLLELNDDFDAARKWTDALLRGFDDTARQVVGPTLLMPIEVGARRP